MKALLESYRNTVVGIIAVFVFLVTFCIVYKTIVWLLGNAETALEFGTIADIIILFAYLIDLTKKLRPTSQNEVSEDLRPKGIRDSEYPEDAQITYLFGHADEVHKKLVEK